MTFRPRIAVLLLLLLLSFHRPSVAALNVFLDFGPTWQSALESVSSEAGVPAFSASERDQIETIIHDVFLTAWSGFDLNIVTADPGGFRDRVDFGAVSSDPNMLGSAVLDFGNSATGTARVFAANFYWSIEAEDDRADQMLELGTSLGGTGIHELAHSYGARHVNAYGTPGINPTNYGNTAGLQNQHFMGTGPTGIDELQRESPRTLSEWTKVIMEVAHGVTAAPRMLQDELLDAGSDIGTAQSLPLSFRDLSGTDAGYLQGRIETETDSDWYSFTVAGPSRVTAELWSDELFILLDDFDGRLRLVAPDGSSTLASSDKIRFNGDVFGPGGLVWSDDAYLLNIPVTEAGTYYLEVSSVESSGAAASGDYRVVLATVPVPEPTGWLMLLVGSRAIVRRRA